MSTTQEILAAALGVERAGHEYYSNAAAEAGSELVRNVLESLARDELQHIEWIQKIAPASMPTAEAANRALYDSLAPLFSGAPSGAAAAESDVKALAHALDIEHEAERAYVKWATEVETEDAARMCTTLAKMERFHGTLLENAIRYLESPGDWFQQEERWFFEGG